MKVKETATKLKKKQKAGRREIIAQKIDHVLGVYKVQPGKNYKKGLKKASKLLSKIIIVPIARAKSIKKVKDKDGSN